MMINISVLEVWIWWMDYETVLQHRRANSPSVGFLKGETEKVEQMQQDHKPKPRSF